MRGKGCSCGWSFERGLFLGFGVVWSCLELFGVVWGCLGLFGVVWGCLELFGVVWSCLELFGVVWGSSHPRILASSVPRFLGSSIPQFGVCLPAGTNKTGKVLMRKFGFEKRGVKGKVVCDEPWGGKTGL